MHNVYEYNQEDMNCQRQQGALLKRKMLCNYKIVWESGYAHHDRPFWRILHFPEFLYFGFGIILGTVIVLAELNLAYRLLILQSTK